MRILALLTDAYGGYGGIAQYNCDFVSALAKSARVKEIVILPRSAADSYADLPLKVTQLVPSSNRFLYILSSIITLLRYGPFDLIFCGHIFHSPLAFILGRFLGIPVWLQTHGIDAWEPPDRFTRYSTEKSTLITVVSRYTKRRLQKWSNVEPEIVRVLPNTFRPLFAPRPEGLNFLERRDIVDRKIILTVSRLSKSDRYKGHEKVIRVLPQIIHYHPDVVYLIVGEGDGIRDLQREVSRIDLASKVKFLGRLSDNKLLELYHNASVFVMPSKKEGFGIVFVEAAAAGLVVIGGNRDGSTDALADGIIGKMIDPDDESELATSLIACLSRSIKFENSSVQRFAFENFARHVDNLLEGLIK